MEALNAKDKSLNGARVLVLGVAYKKDVDDVRESPSLKLIKLLREKGAHVEYNDPYVGSIKVSDDIMTSVEVTDELLSSADCVLLATDHSCYNYQRIVDNTSLLFDARGATRKIGSNNIVML